MSRTVIEPTQNGRRDRGVAPLDATLLERLALAYVGRYATTRAKLRSYLGRKLKERGWSGEGRPEGFVEALVERCATFGYVDDRAFAASRTASLGRRGYGARRVGEALRAAGIEEGDAAAARETADATAWETAIAFARRRRIGAFAAEPADPDVRRKALAAMLRAGHPYSIARRLIEAQPGEVLDAEDSPGAVNYLAAMI
jgi:regulatory protein